MNGGERRKWWEALMGEENVSNWEG